MRVSDSLAMMTLGATLAVTGRGGRPTSCPLDQRGVTAELARMRREPVGLRRPVLILNGYHTPQLETWWARAQLCALTSHRAEDFATVSYPLETRLGRAAMKALRAADRRWGAGTEIDAVGISMGGLVARLAAVGGGLPSAGGQKEWRGGSLKLARLFTFATPHDGAHRAVRVAPDAAARDMKPGSAFLTALHGHERGYELVCYAQEGDNVVSHVGAAPRGHGKFVAPGSRLMAHFTSLHNPYFLVDLARRLRGEEPVLG